MLTALSVSKFAIVDKLTLSWEDGFTVITGETGAGKSIIVDAIGALVGGRVYPDMVQAGASRAIIEGVFAFEHDGVARLEVERLLTEHGIAMDDELLIVTREIATANGRGVARINGRAVPLALLQQVGAWLVDIHGQSEHLSLLRAREQLELLDRYARLLPRRQTMATLVRDLRKVRSERAVLEDESRRARREEALLRHEISEIEAAMLDPEEESELQARRQRLRNAERLQASLSAAMAMLGGEEDRPGAADLAGQAAIHVRDAARYETALASDAEALEQAAADVSEAMHSVTRAMDRLAEEAGELEAVEERVLLIADLKRKYGDSLAAIIHYADEGRERLNRLERHEVLLQELNDREKSLRDEASVTATALAEARRTAALGLADAIQAELNDLGLRGTRIELRFTSESAEDGLIVTLDGEQVPRSFDETGVDRVELLIAPNPGEPPRSLARIASGGELARVALAIKTVLSQVDTRGTLIFDEVDVGVGGRSAGVVGEKLWGLTAHHQVLCITHMPQVAAFADHHVRVQKSAALDATQVLVSPLEPPDRAGELAAMLGGAGAATLASAQELLAIAAAFKEPLGAPMQGKAGTKR